MAATIQIGPSADSVRAAATAIIEIMQVDPAIADSAVKVQALQVLSTLCHVTNTSITGCTFLAREDDTMNRTAATKIQKKANAKKGK